MCGRAAARVEKLGIPAVIITREGFEQAAANAFAGIGFSPEAACATFPIDMFVPGSDLSPIESGFDQLVSGLTRWAPLSKTTGAIDPPRVTVTGKDQFQVVQRLNTLALRNLWGDGLPLLPATEDRVDWLLTGTDRPHDAVLGKILPRGGIATVKSIAVAAAMAGARPEYMPVIIAAIEAIVEPLFYHQGFNSTTNSAFPIVIVNGPIAKQIRLGSGYGCLGPDPQHPAGASIGRTIRLVLLNMGGAIPGQGTMSIFGGPARFTNVVVAEDEDGIPDGWSSVAEERGFAAGTNAVTLLPVNSAINIVGYIPLNDNEAMTALTCFADCMRMPNANYWFRTFTPTGAPGVMLLPRGTVRGLAGLGWTKQKVKEFLWENSRFSPNLWLKAKLDHNQKGGFIDKSEVRWPMPICKSPENIILAVAGGAQSGHSYYLGSYGPAVMSKPIDLPAGFSRLLGEAEDDLGCGSDSCMI